MKRFRFHYRYTLNHGKECYAEAYQDIHCYGWSGASRTAEDWRLGELVRVELLDLND